jgi:hypothetical protein
MEETVRRWVAIGLSEEAARNLTAADPGLAQECAADLERQLFGLVEAGE